MTTFRYGPAEMAPEIPMTRREVRRLVVFTVLATLFLIGCAVVAYGCAKDHVGVPGHSDGLEATAKTEELAAQTKEQAKAIKTNSAGEVRKDIIVKNQDRILDFTLVHRSSYNAMAKAYQDEQQLRIESDQRYARLDSKWYVTAGRWAERLVWIIVGLFGFGIVLRIVAMFAGGWGGTVMATVGSFILSIFPGGGVLNEFFTNYFFRDRNRKLNPPEPTIAAVIPAAAVVAAPAVS